MIEHPIIFISYSHDNEKHKSWALKLANDLTGHGVEVIFDQYDMRLGGNLRFFMQNGLTNARLVLCICSEEYVRKADLGIGGTGFESLIITQPLLEDANSEHIICIIRNNESENKVPIALKSNLYIDFSNDDSYFECYKELLERIYDQDKSKKPPIGKNPFEREIAKKILSNTEIERIKYKSIEMSREVSFNYLNNNGQFNIGSGEYHFITYWSKCGVNSIYSIKDHVKAIGVKPDLNYFPTISEFDSLDYTSRTRCIEVGNVVIWINDYGNFAATKILSVSDNNLTFEYKIYE